MILDQQTANPDSRDFEETEPDEYCQVYPSIDGHVRFEGEGDGRWIHADANLLREVIP